jgi:hypothetical protein
MYICAGAPATNIDSHVEVFRVNQANFVSRYVKDIKNAILAADIIVNQWGFTDYQLDIYGDMEKAASYSVECQELIASRSLGDNVALKGLGDPSKALQDTVSILWLCLCHA